MALISQESLLGMLIPDVYIDGITLESSGTPAIEDNPHIEHDREAASRLAYKQALESRTLRMTVDLSLKERLDNNLIGSWFRQQEFHKYLKLKVMMTTDQRLIRVFSHGQAMMIYASTGIAEAEMSSWPSDVQEVILENFNSLSEFGVAQNLTTSFDSRVLSVSADVIGDNSDLTQVSSTVDENGTSIHDFTYRAVFELGKYDPKDLTVFAVGYLDLGALRDDYDLEFNLSTLDGQNGKVVSENVIKNNSIVSTANVYVTPEGEYWTGPVHKTGSRSWATGSQPTAASVKLIRRSVPNDMIQDFRDVTEIMKYSLDISDANSTIDILNRASMLGSGQRPWMKATPTYFSDIWLSRDNDGGSRFMFAFDVREFLRTKSRFGSILDRQSESVRKQILDASTIRSMKVLRRRVKNVTTLNSLGSMSNQKILFNKAEPYESIVLSGNKSDNTLAETVNTFGTIRESQLTISDDNSDYGIHYYTGQDRRMRHVTDGTYQYGVKVDVEDGTVDFLRSLTSDLATVRRDLKLYLNYGMKLGMTKFLQEISNPHIDHSSERQMQRRENTGHYDPIRNRFTQKFLDFLNEQYETEGAPFYQRRPWIDAAALYANALAILSSEAEFVMTRQRHPNPNVKPINISESINLFLSPTSGTPYGIMTVMRLFDQLISKLQTLTGDDYRERGRASMSGSGASYTDLDGQTANSTHQGSDVSSGQNVPGTFIEIEYWFPEVFDSNVKKSHGLDYLSTYSRSSSAARHKAVLSMPKSEFADIVFGNRQTRGLKIVDGGHWTTRIQQETEKYFTELNPNLDFSIGRQILSQGDSIGNTNYSFLAPSYVVADDIAYSTSADVDDDYFIKIEAGLLAVNQNQYPAIGNTTSETNQSDAQKLYQSTLENVFAKYNLTVQSPLQPQPIPLFLRGVFDYMQSSFCEDQQLQPVDPFPAWNIDGRGNVTVIGDNGKQESLGSTNSDYTDFFKKLSDIVIDNSVLPGDMTTNPTPSAQVIFVSQPSIQGIFETLKVDEEFSNAVASSNGLFKEQVSVSDVVTSMPNQVKSIIASHFNPSVSKHQPKNDWISSSKFNINYHFLQMVERFDGFEPILTPVTNNYSIVNGAWDESMNQTPTHPCVRRPKWTPLTQEFYLGSSGKEILCRLKPYACEQLGFFPKQGIDAPVYDSYFIIAPPNAVARIAAIQTMFDVFRARLENRWSSLSGFMGQFATTNLIT